jgi:hypothetical protein
VTPIFGVRFDRASIRYVIEFIIDVLKNGWVFEALNGSLFSSSIWPDTSNDVRLHKMPRSFSLRYSLRHDRDRPDHFHYRVIEKLNVSGMGVVYKVRTPSQATTVAKFLPEGC